MSLTNSQYDEIMRGYSRRQLEAQHDLDRRRQEVYLRIPQMHDLDELAGSLGVACARSILLGETPRPPAASGAKAFRLQMQHISEERKRLLTDNGFPEDYLEQRYCCPDCHDTGYIGSKPCRCFRKAVIDLYYTQSGLRDALKNENFSRFSLDYYPDDTIIPSVNKTPRQHMKNVLEACLSFLDHFDTAHGNLLFYGETGLGKTFLSHCIAARLLDEEYSVLYYSSETLFREIGTAIFGRDDYNDGKTRTLQDFDLSLFYSCDLLIIDDLGTEMTSSFVAAQLFRLLNERLLARKSTLISTNLSLSALSSLYSERIMSRITSSFTLLAFYGNDIRILKKLQNKTGKEAV